MVTSKSDIIKLPVVTGLVAWFDMADNTSYTNSAGFISAITNKASGVSWTEATNRPTFSATGFNGMPCMDFDGTNDLIGSTESAVYTALANSNAYTIFTVASLDVADDIQVIFSVANSANATNGSKRWGINNTGAGRWTSVTTNDAAAASVVDSTSSDNLVTNILEWYSPGTTVSLQVNGAAADPNAVSQNPGTLTPNRAAIGCRYSSTPTTFFNGKVAEIIIYNNNLNSTDRNIIRRYLSNKWAIDNVT
jgi:hypothetical protein